VTVELAARIASQRRRLDELLSELGRLREQADDLPYGNLAEVDIRHALADLAAAAAGLERAVRHARLRR
jgi:hypothetical protein